MAVLEISKQQVLVDDEDVVFVKDLGPWYVERRESRLYVANKQRKTLGTLIWERAHIEEINDPANKLSRTYYREVGSETTRFLKSRVYYANGNTLDCRRCNLTLENPKKGKRPDMWMAEVPEANLTWYREAGAARTLIYQRALELGVDLEAALRAGHVYAIGLEGRRLNVQRSLQLAERAEWFITPWATDRAKGGIPTQCHI